MHLNFWKLTVDEAFRLTVPANLPPDIRDYFDQSVILIEGEDGCIKIYKPVAGEKLRRFEPIFKVEVKKKRGRSRRNPRDYEIKRIQIPSELRGALSFLYGRTVSLAQCSEESLMLWPRPSNPSRN